ncbi:MAG: VWA domain-containing protein, partial [Arcobacter sp.]|nr:VWA domain-containing protein [Arcobacter sp.]
DKEGNLVTITQDTKIEVYKDQIISLADIGAEKLIFEPTSNSDIDGNLKFEVGDGNGNFSDEYTTAIEIIAVADAPIATINVTKIESSSTSEELIVKVGSTTYDITDILVNKGSYVEVKNIGNNTETSAQNVVVNENLDNNDFLKTSSANNIIVIDGDISGGAKIEPMGGNDFIAILGDLINGTINDSSGIDTLYLGKSSSYYSWTVNAHSGDTGMDGTITQYADEAHTQIVGTLYINNIDGIIFADGHTVGSVEVISTPSTTVDYEVDISAALVDLDGSETLTVTITNVPNGATLSSDSYTLTDNGNNTWSVTIPAGTKSITSTITMTVPESESDNINLGITARATETNDNTDGLNYAETVDTDALVYGIDETNNFVFGKATTNLVVTLDVSGSMANNVKDSSGNYVTRFEIAVDSMIKTIKAYKANGTTEVNLTLFGDGAKNIGWMSADSAIDYLNKLTLTSNSIKYNGSSISGISTGGTDYYNALVKTMSVDSTGHEADNTVSYFLSDGAPNKNTSYTDSDNDNIIKTWKTYVSNNIDTLNVIGVGSGAKVDPLKIIQVQDGDKVIMVTDDSTLGDILLGTVTATITGDVSDNSYFGDGKITINSIVIDGVEYTKTTFPTDGIALDGDGKLSFDFDTGKYNYNAKSSEFSSDITKSFSVNASDEDGDKTTFDVNIKVDVGDKEVVNTLNISGEDIDLTSIISANKSVDVINLENSSKDKISIELNDVLVQEDKQLVIKGDKGDLIELDTPSDWANTGKEQLDGVNYNVYKGIGTNSTIKLLIEDDIDVNPDI